MKSSAKIKAGVYTGEGDCIEPAEIVLTLTELELPEYRSAMMILIKEFKVEQTSTALRKNRDIIIKGADSLHDGKSPVEGNPAKV